MSYGTLGNLLALPIVLFFLHRVTMMMMVMVIAYMSQG